MYTVEYVLYVFKKIAEKDRREKDWILFYVKKLNRIGRNKFLEFTCQSRTILDSIEKWSS